MSTTKPNAPRDPRTGRAGCSDAEAEPRPDQELVGSSWVLRDVHALLAQIRDYAVITLDVEGTVLSWNVGAERVKRFRADEIVGTSFTRFYTEADERAGLPRRLLERAQSDGVAHAVGWRVRRDGTLFWADVTISSLREPDGELAGYVKVTRDVTAQRLLELDREQQYAAFTHDLRAPLTAALGYVDLAVEHIDARPGDDLGSQETSGEGVHAALADSYLKGLLVNATRVLKRLELMMERHLDAARAAGSGQLGQVDCPERLRLAQVVASTVRTTLEPGAADRLQLRIAPETDVAYANRDAVERSLSNVIGNALKYSDDDVTIETTLLGPWVRIAVTDHGRGIHPDDIDTIFEPGERGRLARADGGHGIGLNSVRQLMERQYGRISITSEIGVGTTVHLDLPTTAPTSSDN